MAKYEKRLTGDFDDFLQSVHDDITSGSISVTHEDSSFVKMGEVKTAINVYERYSAIGSNRVSMNVTIVGSGEELFISAITSGGSQAVFWKINTIGENSFLTICENAVEEYIRRH